MSSMSASVVAVTWCVWLSSCALPVQLGGEDPEPAVPENPSAPFTPLAADPSLTSTLRVTAVDLTASHVSPARMARTSAGEVVIATDDALVFVDRAGLTRVEYDGKVGPVRALHIVNDTYLLAAEHGLFACVVDEGKLNCDELEPPGEHEPSRIAVLGFSPMSAGRVLYAAVRSVGTLKLGPSPWTRSQHIKAAVAGTTRAWPWVRLDEAPWACELDRAPPDATICSQAEVFTAPVTQATQVDATTTAIATDGAGVRIRVGTEWQTWNTTHGLADDHVNDLIVWQGELWAATNAGLSRFSTEPTDTSGVPSEPVVALSVNDDGTLLAAIGRTPSRFVRIARR